MLRRIDFKEHEALKLFMLIFPRARIIGHYVIDVQVEKQTAGVLTDEPSWGQQLTVMSPEGGVAALEGLTSSGHKVALKEANFIR